jgi:hypothetical protein
MDKFGFIHFLIQKDVTNKLIAQTPHVSLEVHVLNNHGKSGNNFHHFKTIETNVFTLSN